MRGPRRREQLLDGLIDLFLAEGFRQFTLDDLADRLACSKTTLYGLAPSKEQLITVVVRAFFRRSTERVEQAVEEHSDPAGRLEAYLVAIAGELSPASARFYDDLDHVGPAGEIYARNTASAARRVRELVQETDVSPETAVFAGAVVAQVMEAIQRGRIKELTDLDDATAYRSLSALLRDGLSR